MARALPPAAWILAAFLHFPDAVRGDSEPPPGRDSASPPPAAVFPAGRADSSAAPVVPATSSHLFVLDWTDAGLVAAAMGLQAWAQIRYDGMQAASPTRLDRDDLWAMDRWAAGGWSEEAALASDVLLLPLLAAPLTISALDARRSGGSWTPFLTELLLYSEALALSSSLNLLIRSARIHPRPFHYGDEAPESERRKGEASGSFYSGHANASFLAATYLAYTQGLRYPDSPHGPWLWAGALGYAGTVASLRVAAGKHFPSDILAGAAAGAFFGWLFPRIHLRSGTRGGTAAAGAASLRLLPAPDGGARVVVLKPF